MLTRASFDNFKNLRRVDVDLERFTVLVGPNGAGKTSVLQGIFLLTQLGRHPWPTSLGVSVADLTGGSTEPVSFENRTPFGRVFSGLWAPHRIVTNGQDSLSIAVSEGTKISVATRTALRIAIGVEEDGEDVFTLDRSGVGDGHLVASRGRVREGRPQVLFDASLQHLAAAVLLQLDTALMTRPSVVDAPEPSLSPDGSGLASVLAYLAGAHPDRKEAIEEDVAAIVPWFRRVLVKPAKVSRLAQRPFPVGREVVRVPVEEEVWGHRFEVVTTDGAVVPADLLSEGTVLVLGLLTLLHDPNPPWLLLVDDLDRALHLGAQVRLVSALRAIQDARPELQIVATSHSPFLLQEIRAEEVRVLGLTAGGVRCRPLPEHPGFAKWKGVLGTGEFWANFGEDWVGDGG